MNELDLDTMIDETNRRSEILLSSIEILDNVEKKFPSLLQLEHEYQDERCKYSAEYFKGSPLYVGDSIAEFITSSSKINGSFYVALLAMQSLLAKKSS